MNSIIPEPFQFNPLKHHLAYIKEFIADHEGGIDVRYLIREVRHIGTSVMDIYAGEMSVEDIVSELNLFIDATNISDADLFASWAGVSNSDFRIVTLSDNSQWTLKYQNSHNRFAHLFPARSGPHTFRVKANTLKSAILYIILEGKDFITEDDLNRARALIGLSPVREVADSEAVAEMIEILRS